MPDSLRHNTYLICPEGEQHAAQYQVIRQPPHVTNYSQKVQWLLYDAFPGEEKIIIMDDDLYFSKYDEDGKLRSMTEQSDHEDMFSNLISLLDRFCLVGVHPRMMANNATPPFEVNSKIVTVQGINRTLLPAGLVVDQYPILADVVLNCTLLSMGIQTARITTHFVDWLPSQASGGCDYRTAEMQREATLYIAERFGPFAKQVVKRPKTAKWLGDERYDLNVRWKALYEHGVRNMERGE